MIFLPKLSSRGLTFIEIVLLIVGVAFLFTAVSCRIKGGRGRSLISRVKADQRSLATAIEAYYVDNLSYPACDSSEPNGDSGWAMNRVPGATKGLKLLPTFRGKQNKDDELHTLTTPVAYFTEYFVDPFATTKKAIYAYSTPSLTLNEEIQNGGWIVWSFGPDRDEIDKEDGRSGDIELENYGEANTRVDPLWYNPNEKIPSDILLLKGTYDPTNGTVSNGDVYRPKQ